MTILIIHLFHLYPIEPPKIRQMVDSWFPFHHAANLKLKSNVLHNFNWFYWS